MKTSAKYGFSLVELLVVIGIIAILAGVLLSQFGGATDSARASQCATNLRNLVTAAQTCASRETNGYYPAAGSFIWKNPDHKAMKLTDHKRVGWIAGSEDLDTDVPSPVSPVAFNASDDERIKAALHHGNYSVGDFKVNGRFKKDFPKNKRFGRMWEALGGSRAAYQCPVHAAACKKVLGRNPGWSYVMNQAFGYDESGNQKFRGQTLSGIANPDKFLVFAELQGIDIDDKVHGVQIRNTLHAGGTEADAVLNYATESIGFNHKAGRGRYAAHVAFADGHVEKILNPFSGSTQKLTEWLCQGKEISFNGKYYSEVK